MNKWNSMKKIISLFIFILTFTHHINAQTINLLYDTKSDGTIYENSIWIVEMIKEAATKNNIEVNFEGAPWSRALTLVESGVADGLINASYKKSRSEFAVYPIKDGKLDTTKSLKTPTYHFYTTKSSSFNFDGNKLINAKGLIGAIKSYAVVDDLKRLKASIEYDINTASNLQNVLHKKITAAALLEHEADMIIQSNPVMKQKLKKLPIPVRKKEYYLIFSKSFFKNNSAVAQTLWEEIKELKMSQKYLQQKAAQ